VELRLTTPLTIRLPERLDRSGLAALRRDVEAADVGGVALVRGSDHGSFCRGISFEEASEVDPVERDAGLADFEVAMFTLVRSTTRTIACVRGSALGGGLGIAAACDVVIAAGDARFGLPEPLFGLIPGLVLPLIRIRTGSAVLRRLALGGDSVDAEEAFRVGLVDEVTPPDQLEACVDRWARRLDRAEPSATGRLKGWLADMDDLESEIGRGRDHLAELLGSEIVARRVERFQRGLAPWGDDDASV
jgi:enoyl-CoA hydratase/carnithine racemase